MLPSLPHFSEKFFPVFCQRLDRGAWNSGVLMARAPDEQFQQRRREINSLLGQPVVNAPAIGDFRFCADDAGGLQTAQPPGKDVGCDSLARILKILECPEATNHHVANDQQRPAIAEDLERDTDRTARPLLRLGFRKQFSRRYQYHLQNASRLGTTCRPIRMKRSLAPQAASSTGSRGETPTKPGESV